MGRPLLDSNPRFTRNSPSSAVHKQRSLWFEFPALIHEWRIPLLPPLILPAGRRGPSATMGTVLCLSTSAKASFAKQLVVGDAGNLVESLAQLWYFLAGSLIARAWTLVVVSSGLADLDCGEHDRDEARLSRSQLQGSRRAQPATTRDTVPAIPSARWIRPRSRTSVLERYLWTLYRAVVLGARLVF